MLFSCHFLNYMLSVELFSLNIAFWDISQTYGISFPDRKPETTVENVLAAVQCQCSSKTKINQPIQHIIENKQKFTLQQGSIFAVGSVCKMIKCHRSELKGITFKNKKREGTKLIIFITECFPVRKNKTCDRDYIYQEEKRGKKRYCGGK